MDAAQEEGFLLGALLWAPYEALTKRVQEGYAAAGFSDLRPAHAPVFRHLAPDGERVTTLAARVGTSKQALGYLVDALVAQGYLERLPDPTDGRAQIVRRTARGWAVNRLARRVVAEVQAEWTAALGEERMAQVLTGLRELAGLLGVDYAGSISALSASAQEGRPLDP